MIIYTLLLLLYLTRNIILDLYTKDNINKNKTRINHDNNLLNNHIKFDTKITPRMC